MLSTFRRFISAYQRKGGSGRNAVFPKEETQMHFLTTEIRRRKTQPSICMFVYSRGILVSEVNHVLEKSVVFLTNDVFL